MALRAILLPVIGDGQSPAELSVGVAVAQTFAVHLDAVFIRPDPAEAFQYMGFGTANRDALERDMRQRVDLVGGAQAERHRRRFGTLCRKAGLSRAHRPEAGRRATAAWQTLTGEAAELVPAIARRADLSVFTASPARYNPLIENLLEVTLLRSGRPVLFVPEGAAVSPFARPLVAWDNLSGCARAVSALVDLAGEATAAMVLHVSEEAGEEEPDMSDVIAHLGWHGIAAETITRPQGGARVGATLLDMGEDIGADLLVMGGYGHGRYREALLGGVTRFIIRHARLPVLMAH